VSSSASQCLITSLLTSLEKYSMIPFTYLKTRHITSKCQSTIRLAENPIFHARTKVKSKWNISTRKVRLQMYLPKVYAVQNLKSLENNLVWQGLYWRENNHWRGALRIAIMISPIYLHLRRNTNFVLIMFLLYLFTIKVYLVIIFLKSLIIINTCHVYVIRSHIKYKKKYLRCRAPKFSLFHYLIFNTPTPNHSI